MQSTSYFTVINRAFKISIVSYERLSACPVCGKSEFRNKLVVEDKSVSKESFAIVQCESCGFQFTNPRPGPADIGRYYESDEYVSHNSGAQGVINQAYKVARFFTMRRKVALLNKQAPRKGKVLDYGCGTGHFLAAASQMAGRLRGARAQCAGPRRSSSARRSAYWHERSGGFSAESFDAITLWHVLEHVHT